MKFGVGGSTGLELVTEIKRVLELEMLVVLPVCLPHFDAYSEKVNFLATLRLMLTTLNLARATFLRSGL
ncbi:unnamed protein product [Lathyrus oleraceus]